MQIRFQYRFALVMIMVVMLTGSIGFRLIEGWSLFEGFYMTLITMTTVGYGEVKPLSEAGKVFNTFLITASFITGGVLIGTFTHAMVEFE